MNSPQNAPDTSWMAVVRNYSKPSVSKSIWQIINSVVPYLILWVLMYKSLEISYWLTLALSIVATGFMVRIFIIFHDCGHNSFFKDKKWNTRVGMFMGLFSFTAFYKWQNNHQGHHETVGNLDNRGIGDVMTLTADEYRAKSKRGRFWYRFYRFPIVLFFLGGLFVFVFKNRVPNKMSDSREKLNIWLTNLVLIVLIGIIGYLIGYKEFILIQLPVIWLSSAAGSFLFYVQHQFEGVVWDRKENWDYKTMALDGSSFFKLPKILQWFSGNIGFHHVHHLGPRIPNYLLEKAHKENTIFSNKEPISLRQSMKTLKLKLWDEQHNIIIPFSEV